MRWRKRGKQSIWRVLWRFSFSGKSTGKLHRRIINIRLNHTKRNIKILHRSRSGSSTSQYPLYQQQQQQYYHQQISKSKRSKSMDDFATQMVFEQSSRIQRNNIRNGGSHHQTSSSSTQMGKRSPPNNALGRAPNHQQPQPQHKNQMRYSVDNLLEIDTSYYNNYQVSSGCWESDLETIQI